MQPKLPEECGKPTWHAEIPGGSPLLFLRLNHDLNVKRRRGKLFYVFLFWQKAWGIIVSLEVKSRWDHWSPGICNLGVVVVRQKNGAVPPAPADEGSCVLRASSWLPVRTRVMRQPQIKSTAQKRRLDLLMFSLSRTLLRKSPGKWRQEARSLFSFTILAAASTNDRLQVDP